MFGLGKPARRFSLVLLEEKEDYVADWVAQCKWPAQVAGNWQSLEQLQGTLRLCSKALYFEPEDVRIPIVRLPLKAAQTLEPVGGRAFRLVTTQLVKMKANMADAPYGFERGRPSTWVFTLLYAQMADFLPTVHHYLAASRLPSHERDEALQELAYNRAATTVFDTSRLVDFTETFLYDQPSVRHTPLVKEFGRLVITTNRLYFQALDNVAGDTFVRSHPLAGIAVVARRNSALRPTGLEVFFIEGEEGQGSGPSWGSPSSFFAFESEAERERVVSILMAQPGLASALPGGRSAAAIGASILEADTAWLQRITAAWQQGELSNLDYLLYLNLVSRSFHDLTQYPVFPWVVADYSCSELDLDDPACFRDLSLPMGAMDPVRLATYQRRFQEMPREEGMDPPFLYGTHYSCPGYVMFWLVRAAPAHLLRLQNGKFDAPDRLFLSVGKAYESAASSPADVKELIPEFYMADPSFLVNGEQLPLGTRQNGKPVGDVELPAWASSPSDFLVKHRAALESSVVSANLHHWIDLIFGYKQQGRAAEEANNVFHHYTYEGSFDMEAISDPLQKQAAEIAVNEFGRCPRQIFTSPHPPRLVCPTPAQATAIATSASGERKGRRSISSGEADGGQALSLSLISLIVAATSTQQATSPDPKALERLRQLDVSQRAQEAESSPSNKPAAQAQTIAPKDAVAEGRKRWPEKPTRSSMERNLRGWGASLGGRVSGLVGTLTKEVGRPGGVGRSQTPAAEQEGARPSGAQRFAEASDIPASEVAAKVDELTSLEEAQAASLMGAAAPQGVEHRPDADVAAAAEATRDHSADELAAALGQTEIATARPSSPPPTQPKEGQPSSSSPPGLDRSSRRWGPGVRHRLSPQQLCVAASNAPMMGVAVWRGTHVYCATEAGSLKVFDASSGAQVRAANLGMPLTSLALLEGPASAKHPTAISGCFDNQVYAYSVDFGRVLGSFAAHDDTVSCLEICGRQLLSASLDCSVKSWSLEEGREPWKATPALPVDQVEADGAVACISCGDSGVLLAGLQEGAVSAWDLRSQEHLWQVEGSEAVTGVALCPGDNLALAASADGSLALLELRKAGACLARIQPALGLQCCQTDGSLALAGSSTGEVHFWDVGQQLGHASLGGFPPPSPSGEFPTLPAGKSGITSLDMAASGGLCCLATGHKDGSLSIFSERC